jgi:hypothetical protein
MRCQVRDAVRGLRVFGQHGSLAMARCSGARAGVVAARRCCCRGRETKARSSGSAQSVQAMRALNSEPKERSSLIITTKTSSQGSLVRLFLSIRK